MYPAIPSDNTDTSDVSDDDTFLEDSYKHGTDPTPSTTPYTDFFSTGTSGIEIPVGFDLMDITTKPKGYAGTNAGALGLGPGNADGSTNYVDVLYSNKLIQERLMSISFVSGTGTNIVFGKQPTTDLAYSGDLTAF